MKTFHSLLFSALALLIQSCREAPNTEVHGNNTRDNSIDHGCLASYEVNAHGDTINRVYEGDIKEGQWIVYEMMRGNNGLVRSKTGEGFYRKNKKEGFWKTYNSDGTIKDSVNYQNDLPSGRE